MKKALKIASIVHMVVWIVIFIAIVAEIFIYKASPSEEPFEAFLDEVFLMALFFLAAFGIFNSALLSACLHTFFAVSISRLKGLKNTALRFSVLSDLLFYLSVILLFAVQRDWVFFVMRACAICTLVSVVLFVVLKIKKFVMSKNISDGSIPLSSADGLKGEKT